MWVARHRIHPWDECFFWESLHFGWLSMKIMKIQIAFVVEGGLQGSLHLTLFCFAIWRSATQTSETRSDLWLFIILLFVHSRWSQDFSHLYDPVRQHQKIASRCKALYTLQKNNHKTDIQFSWPSLCKAVNIFNALLLDILTSECTLTNSLESASLWKTVV